MTPTVNPYQRAARLQKSMALVVAIGKAGLTSEQVAGLSDGQWATLAVIAGVNKPSEETKALVLDAIRRER